jgi:hypothetical protein
MGGPRTFDLYLGVGVLLHGFEVVLVVVVIVRLHHVAVRIEARWIALEDIAFVACVVDVLEMCQFCGSVA